MEICVRPHKLAGKLAAPDSKSDTSRKLLCAALCNRGMVFHMDTTFISDDVEAMIQCLRALGTTITILSDTAVEVAPGAYHAKVPQLDCRESATVLRFMLPVAAALYGNASFSGIGSLSRRPILPMLKALEAHGVYADADRIPLSFSGFLSAGTYKMPGDVSSQFISGLLLAMPLLDEESRIKLTSPLESAAYVDMTIQTMSQFGVKVEKTKDGFKVPANQQYRSPEDLTAEKDWSSCSFLYPFGAEFEGLDPNSLQPDRAIRKYSEILAPGAEIGTLTIDVSPHPDLFPILAVLACRVHGKVVLSSAKRLRIKESDRIVSTAALINGLGGRAEEVGDTLVITGTGSLTGGRVSSFGDHRIAMAAVAASSICTGDVYITDAQVIKKSYPGFLWDFNALGGTYYVL
ncbi:MAG: 3-phosphoshikimate 1-carboxyvinyltransferase [Spirochaetia bacterium]|nr:3-phosphoshikimate 1-carboxyvinyltransferase [Spirochaetia bacterium]MBQ3647304.1 3-phosphoshikimate 1-carboxyvinyltransferase [Spirochaetia bacterium]MBQ3713861.1 3-phosphoshikimate 1-carboxyvinyltransferase [Spirochaetia bacterium]MBQ6673025.1 3-phosphoshikimate 1-carboxyvinyltransferase [Spirochaetia bacterium]MBQ6905065.1 3-phosphoshikimate 1-carboxyvinyltransferase [Spirochaetia bacterium]